MAFHNDGFLCSLGILALNENINERVGSGQQNSIPALLSLLLCGVHLLKALAVLPLHNQR